MENALNQTWIYLKANGIIDGDTKYFTALPNTVKSMNDFSRKGYAIVVANVRLSPWSQQN
jgi:hypothetical protein